MATTKTTEKNKKNKSSNNRKRLGISAVAVIDNIVFSQTDSYAYYQLSNNVYDFLSSEQKVALAMRISNAFNNLMTEKQEPIECQLIITSAPVDVDAWAEQIKEVSKDWKTGPGFERYVEEQIMYLKNRQYMKKMTFLGVNLGKRGALNMAGLNVFESGFKGAMETLKTWMDTIIQTPTEAVSAQEENDARKKEEELFRILSIGHLKAQRVTSEEILLLIKRQFYPAMPAPYLDVDHENRIGPGDIDLEVGSAIENKYRWLKITQMFDDVEVSGYRATLSFAKFPKDIYYPAGIPFLYFPSRLGAPFTCYSRFTLHPNQKMKLELEKKKKEQKDELENISAAQNSLDSAVDSFPADVAQALDNIHRLSEMLAADKTPWVEGSYRIVVEAPTEETLREYCSKLKQSYDDLGILLQWTAGDQAQLFLEQMPGDTHRVQAFSQITNLDVLSTSGMNFSSDVGDLVFGTD